MIKSSSVGSMLAIMYLPRGPQDLQQTALEQGPKEMRPKSLLFRSNTQLESFPNSAEHKEKHHKNISKHYPSDQSITWKSGFFKEISQLICKGFPPQAEFMATTNKISDCVLPIYCMADSPLPVISSLWCRTQSVMEKIKNLKPAISKTQVMHYFSLPHWDKHK